MYVNFDAAAATIILSLNSLNTQLQQTDTELSTGNAVNSPADNPVLWAEASATESYAGAWGAVANEIEGMDSPVLTTATGALSSVLSTLGDMKTTIEDVQADSDDAVTALPTLLEYGQTLKDTVDDAVASNGVNLLDGSTATVSFVDGYNQTGGVQSATFTTKALIKGDDSILQAAQAGGSATATDLTKLTDDDLLSANIGTTLDNIDKAIADVTSYSASIGDMSTSETTMQDFAQTMQTNMENGADDLIAANPSALAARETALQTQIQLATQALSISNQMSQLVLKLFQ